MGATKRSASCWGRRRRPRRYLAVRFGNVLASRGSVVPTFAKQIDMGGPVTITDPAMSRYFMSISEAASLIVQAASFTGGSDVFLLDMGEEINILDLARRMIRMRGLRPEIDVPIVVARAARSCARCSTAQTSTPSRRRTPRWCGCSGCAGRSPTPSWRRPSTSCWGPPSMGTATRSAPALADRSGWRGPAEPPGLGARRRRAPGRRVGCSARRRRSARDGGGGLRPMTLAQAGGPAGRRGGDVAGPAGADPGGDGPGARSAPHRGGPGAGAGAVVRGPPGRAAAGEPPRLTWPGWWCCRGWCAWRGRASCWPDAAERADRAVRGGRRHRHAGHLQPAPGQHRLNGLLAAIVLYWLIVHHATTRTSCGGRSAWRSSPARPGAS